MRLCRELFAAELESCDLSKSKIVKTPQDLWDLNTSLLISARFSLFLLVSLWASDHLLGQVTTLFKAEGIETDLSNEPSSSVEENTTSHCDANRIIMKSSIDIC